MKTSKANQLPYNDLKIRHPEVVMKLDRMGSFFPFRLSFARIMIRNLMKNKTKIACLIWDFDNDGYGHAVYTLDLEGKNVSLIAFSPEESLVNFHVGCFSRGFPFEFKSTSSGNNMGKSFLLTARASPF